MWLPGYRYTPYYVVFNVRRLSVLLWVGWRTGFGFVEGWCGSNHHSIVGWVAEAQGGIVDYWDGLSLDSILVKFPMKVK